MPTDAGLSITGCQPLFYTTVLNIIKTPPTKKKLLRNYKKTLFRRHSIYRILLLAAGNIAHSSIFSGSYNVPVAISISVYEIRG